MAAATTRCMVETCRPPPPACPPLATCGIGRPLMQRGRVFRVAALLLLLGVQGCSLTPFVLQPPNPRRQSEMERTSSIELEPRTLTYAELQNAREAAMLILSSKSLEEAIKIFTEGVKPVPCIKDKTYINRIDNDDEEEEEDDDEMMDYLGMEQTYRPSF